MKPRSCKAKGRKLQNLVRDLILKTFPALTSRDVQSTIMGEAGVDVKLSTAAFWRLPYSIECKNLARIVVYKYYNQGSKDRQGEPLLVIKQNNSEPLAVISLDHFMELCKVYSSIMQEKPNVIKE